MARNSHAPTRDDRTLPFLRTNHRPPKPRTTGLTEIRGPYYTPMGKRHLQDVLETCGQHIDSLKFAGGSFTIIPRPRVKELIDLCHEHSVTVSTGGFIEFVLTQGQQAVEQYIDTCKRLEFDTIEISTGFINVPQIVQLECLRTGIWGTKSTWGRILTFGVT